MKKLQKIQQVSGGRDLAVKVIEDTCEVGKDHLVDQAMVKHYLNLSFCTNCIFWIIFLAFYGALTTFTVLYFFEGN